MDKKCKFFQNNVKSIGAQRTLYDIRDGESYRIRKLADGNCWMTKNLDLALIAGKKLTPADTDITKDWTIAASEATVKTAGEKWGTGSTYSDATQITNAEQNTVHSYNGDGSAGSRTVATNAGNATPTVDGSNLVSPVETQNIGVYYNWYAATAKSGTAKIETDGAKATDSICPKGWKMPDNDGAKSFYNLLVNYYGLKDENANSNGKIRSFPLSFVYSGRYRWDNGTIGQQGARGYWWTNTANGHASTHSLYINNSPGFVPQTNFVRAYGFSIRCVAK